jgi:hypothetical protein
MADSKVNANKRNVVSAFMNAAPCIHRDQQTFRDFLDRFVLG